MTGPPDRAAARRRGGLAARVRGDPAPGRADRPSTARRTPSQRAADHRAVPADRPGPHRARHRPARALVLPPARVAQEGRAGQRHLPAQQPVHLPVDGEAQRLLRDGAARASRSRRPRWCPTRTRSTTSAGPTPRRSTTATFDLDAIADELGYPLYMKPFDGGGWRGVSRINDRGDLHRAYDESGEMLMHLQATVDYEHFARALSIGPETMVMDFRPDQPMHKRYAVSHGFLSQSAGSRRWRSAGSSTRSSAGSSTPARCSSPATRSTRSTTPTPAPTSR